MPKNAYSVYGLHIHSEIACPELSLDPGPARNPDVTIRLLPAVSGGEQFPAESDYEVRPGLFHLAVKGVGRYRVEQGIRITVEPVAGASADEVRLYLMGSVMGALLYQRGLFPLHGSAVETQWGVMIFVGAQGVGKSTLAARFYRRGYRLLSDDVCALSVRDGRLHALPALSQFRLCADAFERIDSPREAYFNVDKFVIPLGNRYCPHAAPLGAIHVLVDQEEGEPRFELLRGFDRVQNLLENLYRPHYLKGQETQGDLLRMAGQIAQQAPVARVARQRDAGEIDALIDFLEAAWARHFHLESTKEKV